MTASTPAQSQNVCELITSQVNFGLAFIQEARTAYNQGRFEYGDLARQIALNAYSTANRFAARLPANQDFDVLNDVTRFKEELDTLLQESVAVPSIA
jgi:hypothetical protein